MNRSSVVCAFSKSSNNSEARKRKGTEFKVTVQRLQLNAVLLRQTAAASPALQAERWLQPREQPRGKGHRCFCWRETRPCRGAHRSLVANPPGTRGRSDISRPAAVPGRSERAVPGSGAERCLAGLRVPCVATGRHGPSIPSALCRSGTARPHTAKMGVQPPG